ncbi:MAG: tRNA (adenosine(37)-N6)-threonylcarbamoyltransferase complex ATPase subunit type 1 TsaE [Saprospiraceae bacterium]|nr:tRNA (adenosine(37)-N6)-threonylcarbamoyltransferase complex ATPase subunit type 1 TsaE [Saprospiraceae bacterium]
MTTNQQEFLIETIEDLDPLLPQILSLAKNSGIVLFQGEIGAGKTTLIQKLCKYLGVSSPVTSPTFSLANEYAYVRPDGSTGRIFHLDLYRLESLEEALQIGFEDYLYEGDFCFIEWPEIVSSVVPEDALMLQLEHLDNSQRKILFL